MAFQKPAIKPAGANAAPKPQQPAEPDIWAIFRALRDTRALFGLRPGHIHTLQAMLSFLKPGHGNTVFASNASICQRVGGIDERTLRRHVSRLVELGFVMRNDSPNQKRYRVRSARGACISYGLSLSPLFARATELIMLAQEAENDRRDRMFLRKQILTRLAHLDEVDPDNRFCLTARKTLRRKLTSQMYRALLTEAEAECALYPTCMTTSETTQLSANDGQTVRHHSMSEEGNKDIEDPTPKTSPNLQTLTALCDQATSFATSPLKSWNEVENHARTLAPMMGIDPGSFEKAKNAVGAIKASSAIFIMLQLGSQIRDFAAYFHSITLGGRQHQFDPATLLRRLSLARPQMA